MLEPGDRVLAALSGGLDSLVMLEVLLDALKPADFVQIINAANQE